MQILKTFGLKILALLLVTGATVVEGGTPRILFIGNSYTSYNDLPKLFQQVVASTGAAAPEAKASTPGGSPFAQHLQEAGTLKLVEEGNWDVVILQGQSQEAAASEDDVSVRTRFLSGASNLCQRVRAASPAARIVFYQTWARHADYWKDLKAGVKVGRNPAEMQARTRKWYQRAAGQFPNCTVAPVGDAWELHYQQPGAARFHKPDNSHPEWQGSYLAALVIYGAVVHPPKMEVPFHGNLSDSQAASLQSIAAQVFHRKGTRSQDPN